MRELQKILVCLDLSDYSKTLMEFGVALARGMMTEIVAVNVINMRDIGPLKDMNRFYPHSININNYVERVHEDRYRKVQEIIHEHFRADKSRIRTIIKLGIPFKQILEVLEAESIDLVVIGNEGRSNIEGTLFGTTAEKVFRHSPVPVLSIRHNEHLNR